MGLSTHVSRQNQVVAWIALIISMSNYFDCFGAEADDALGDFIQNFSCLNPGCWSYRNQIQ